MNFEKLTPIDFESEPAIANSFLASFAESMENVGEYGCIPSTIHRVLVELQLIFP